MKRILAIFAALIFAVAVNAQDHTFVYGGTAGVTNATASAKVAAYNYVFKVDVPAPVLYTYSLHLDDNTGSNTATAVLAGSLDNVNYKTITSVSYKGAGSDTTIIGNITANPVTYKYLRWTITPSDTIWVKSIYMSVLPTVK